ncbi:MAG: hypothetical protein APF80_13570 [Alphaproteobacteria bacterium BRH_c36]|nr:MAG: hypothetical protein APF80_13570 [Alphaproteobacteria bacterium BRH_c36]
MSFSNRAIRIGLPIGSLGLCVFLWFHIASNSAALDAVPNAVGPGGWPRAMLIGLATLSALTLILELLEWRRSIRSGVEVAVAAKESNGAQAMALVGVGIILAYGFSIPYVGFAFATMAFLATWCLLGRVRSPVTVLSVSIIGSIVLLYMFVAVAKMPLNRGVEPFNSATISLYRALRIY